MRDNSKCTASDSRIGFTLKKSFLSFDDQKQAHIAILDHFLLFTFEVMTEFFPVVCDLHGVVINFRDKVSME